jgi:hypothetical protein
MPHNFEVPSLALALALASVGALACSVTVPAGPNPGGPAGSSPGDHAGDGKTPAPSQGDECAVRCARIEAECKLANVCDALCARVTSRQAACLEDAHCDATRSQACVASVQAPSSPTPSSPAPTTAAAKPGAIVLSGKLAATGDPFGVLSDDQKMLTVSLSGRASPVTYSPSVTSDVLDSMNASAGGANWVSPDPGACTYRPRLQFNDTEASFSFVAVDEIPSSDCVKYANAIRDQGLDVVFAAVPYANGGSAQVEVKLTAP